MAATNPEISTNREEIMNSFEIELEKLHQRCLQHKTSPREIKKAAQPFFEIQDEISRQRKLSQSTVLKFAILPIFVLMISGLIYNPVSYRFVSACYRHTLVKILPAIDWTQLSQTSCFIPNPLDLGNVRPLLQEHCKLCTNVTEVGVVQQSSLDELSIAFMEKDFPVIVLNIASSQQPISIEDLAKLYLDQDDMSLYTSCDFESSVNTSALRNQRGLLSAVRNGHVKEYYAHWQNCFQSAAKLFRQMYTKPDWLLSSIEIATSSWVYVCSDYKQRKQIQLPMLGEIMILLQLSGDLDLVFKPRSPCNRTCNTLKTTLPQGSSLFLRDYLYEIDYMTCTSGTSITVGLTGIMDIFPDDADDVDSNTDGKEDDSSNSRTEQRDQDAEKTSDDNTEANQN